jgi:hypothetical protein
MILNMVTIRKIIVMAIFRSVPILKAFSISMVTIYPMMDTII